ncbi:MAG: lytic transglycosylase domain-containing protein [Alphaproteobacteria bacterium]
MATAAAVAKGPLDAETVSFADPQRAPVQVMRGPRQSPLSPPPAAQPLHSELVSFGSGEGAHVTVLRSGPASSERAADPSTQTRSETISFANPLQPAVTVVRGAPSSDRFPIGLFGSANGGELDRIAFAVDGVESRHGADLRMWRPEPDGPQGPMQVSAEAAFDVGGGDRFDLQQNRLLGRAYLAQMFRRYGNWADALAAYNWGPGNMDLWIAGGRRTDELPFDVTRYVARVLRDAVITSAAR